MKLSRREKWRKSTVSVARWTDKRVEVQDMAHDGVDTMAADLARADREAASSACAIQASMAGRMSAEGP